MEVPLSSVSKGLFLYSCPMSENWFATWFDSPLYHILYAHRDNTEAKRFINTLFDHLAPKRGARVLDLACGRGRHAIEIQKLGFDVTGVDLSKQSIDFAQSFANENLHFERQDMRKLPYNQEFDIVVNLFTSFGYFRKASDNINVLSSIQNALKPGGTFVLDYLNPEPVIQKITPKESVTKDGYTFHITRSFDEGRIIKEIEVTDGNTSKKFHEDVGAYTCSELTHWAEESGMKVVEVFGDYELNPHSDATSSRTILVCKKVM